MMILELLLLVFYAFTLGVILTTYLFYPFLIKIIFKSNQKDTTRADYGISYVIIPAYNEEGVIEEKVKNTIKFMAPKSEIVVVSDSSDDRTNSICEKIADENEKVTFYVNGERGGKNTCLNLAFKKIDPNEDDILIFTDCNTFFDENTLSEITDSLLSGSSLVAGSMVYESMESGSAVSEGLYWKYEEWIRNKESEKGRLIVCNGGLFGMWADNYKTLPSFVPNDFEGPLRLCGNGKNVIFNPNAKAYERAINSAKEEYSRKERQANRQMNCIVQLWSNINFTTKFQVLFHKFFRWFGLHLFLIATGLIIGLFAVSEAQFLWFLFFCHIGIVFIIGLASLNQNITFDKKILPKVSHAVKVHIFSAKGTLEALKGGKKAIWEKASSNR